MPRAKRQTVFVCDSCGNETPRWEGKCPSCNRWNSLAEVPREARDGRGRSWLRTPAEHPQELTQVSVDELPRVRLASPETNRVVGGGLVPGSLTLIAGDPGIGKSTLLLRVASDVANTGGETIYVSGEESAAQVKMRADRMGVAGNGIYVLPSTDLDDVLEHLERTKPALVVVDSIQAVYDDSVTSDPGSLAQIRSCTMRLMRWAKAGNTPVILSGHVTKGGEVAGPRVLEHMVDTVLYMEGDPVSSWRLLRSVKNRFGSTDEVGVYEMTEGGLVEVDDPSQTFMAERRAGTAGSAVVPTIQGSRPLLVEIQALTSPSALPTPRRVATGVDFNRLLLVCAVVTRRAGIALSGQDVVVNVAGGLKINEPAADLGLALAIASSMRNTPLDPDTAVIGELGLSGEIRMVHQLERRVREAARLGLKRCVVPAGAGSSVGIEAAETVAVDSLAEALRVCLPRTGCRSGHRDQTTDV